LPNDTARAVTRLAVTVAVVVWSMRRPAEVPTAEAV
jgi:hypothetical protein